MGKDFLYHYTNLFAFASIIKNRSIRFSPLSKMDDINDGQSKDFETISQYVFASSWTYSNEESIPFWAMYTNDMHGVRIGLPKNPFKKVCFPEPYEKVGNANTCFLMEQGVLLPVTSIDLKIDDAYFEQMEILTGPKMTGEERHFLDFLIDEYGASIKNPVHSSQLKIR